MSTPPTHHPDGPGWYEIRVQERLDPRWAGRFDGMALSYLDGCTLLEGPVTDQAALHGLLHQLRDTGLTLVSVSRTDDRPQTSRPTDTQPGA